MSSENAARYGQTVSCISYFEGIIFSRCIIIGISWLLFHVTVTFCSICSSGTRIDLSVSHYFCALSGHDGDCGSFRVQTMEKEKNNEGRRHS